MPFFGTFLDKAMPVLAAVQGEDMLRQWCLALRERVDEEAGKTSTRAARSVRCAGVAQAVFDERPRATGAGLPGAWRHGASHGSASAAAPVSARCAEGSGSAHGRVEPAARVGRRSTPFL